MATTRTRMDVSGHRPWPRPDRAPTLAVGGSAALLALATALALVSLGAALSPSRPAVPVATGDAAVVRRFVAAANAVLAGADPAALDAAIAPDAAVHLRGLREGNRAALAGHLAALGRGTPGLRLELADVAPGDDRVAARLGMRGAPGAHVGAPVEGSVWLRLVDGRAAEVWYDLDADAFPRRLPGVAAPAWTGPTPVTLARFVLPAGTILPDLAASGIQVLFAEAGEVAVEPEGPGVRLADGLASDWRAVLSAEGSVRLRPGDALLADPGVVLAIHNPGTAPAAILGLATWPAAPLTTGQSERSRSAQRNGARAYQRSVGSRVDWPDGASSTLLARGAGATRFGPCAAPTPLALTVTRATLAPGQAMPAHPVRGVEVVALEPQPPPPVPPERGDRLGEGAGAQSDPTLRGIDFGAAASDRPAPEVRNASARPLGVTVFAIVADDSGPPAQPVSGPERTGSTGAGPGERPPAPVTLPPDDVRFVPAATPSDGAIGRGSCGGAATERLGTAR